MILCRIAVAAIVLASQLGAATLTAFVVTGQLVCSVIFDHFGWLSFDVHPANWARVAGCALMVIGLILLIIPGLILYTIWFVSVAACVVERTGAWASMRRSRELTKGHRWKVFGIVLLLLLLSLVSSLLQLLLTAAGGETLALIGTTIWTAIGSAFSSVLITVTYYELRAAKEGIDIEQIASVFD